MTNAQMIDQIKTLLGYPAIDLEIDDAAISTAIQNALLVAKDHIQVRRYKTYTAAKTKDVYQYYSYSVDLSELDFDIVTEVYRGDFISPYYYDQYYLVNYATRGVPASLAMAMNYQSNAEALINRSWKVIGKTLYLDKYYSAITIEFIPNVIGIEDVDDSYWVNWIMRYSLAVCKEILGRIRGKLVVDSNPYKTDAEALLSESTSEKLALVEEISSKGFLDITR